ASRNESPRGISTCTCFPAFMDAIKTRAKARDYVLAITVVANLVVVDFGPRLIRLGHLGLYPVGTRSGQHVLAVFETERAKQGTHGSERYRCPIGSCKRTASDCDLLVSELNHRGARQRHTRRYTVCGLAEMISCILFLVHFLGA